MRNATTTEAPNTENGQQVLRLTILAAISAAEANLESAVEDLERVRGYTHIIDSVPIVQRASSCAQVATRQLTFLLGILEACSKVLPNGESSLDLSVTKSGENQ
jgi:hypothetical protein